MLTDSSIVFYDKLLQKKIAWLPIEPNEAQNVAPEVTITLQKALALSLLELPVGQWCSEELNKNKDLPKNVQQLLRSNIEDEARHDLALNNLRKVFEVPKEFDQRVLGFIDEANKLSELYSPITTIGVIEASIFFVILPMFRYLGTAPMRTIANDISNDEQVHVSCNVQLARDLDYRRGLKLDKFRKEVVSWLTEDLAEQDSNPKLTKDFWRKSSDNLYYQGKTDSFKMTQNAVMPAFFEHSNTNLPIYG